MVEFSKFEKKWQNAWEKDKIFEVNENSKKKKYYVLEMWPYPSSGVGLHMGHVRNYTIGDVFARFKRMQGFNVLYPMGYDSFGLPAENAAIKAKSHPKLFTEKAIKTFIQQQKALGLSYDWTRTNSAHTPEYYHWDQWIFLKLLEKGLAYKKKSSVNWCPECKTVLANEQVHDGKCWRHSGTSVEMKDLEQWFFKTTEYADELYSDIDELKDWAEDVKLMQKNWIGKSQGVNVQFAVKDKKVSLEAFTTTIDTMYGVTFVVISPEHPLVKELVTSEHKTQVDIYLTEASKKTDQERMENKDKSGVFTGSYLINPVNGEEIPLWVADYVLMSYGTGVVMGVPAHDQRDMDFATENEIDIIEVLESKGKSFVYDDVDKYTVKGTLINSDSFNGKDILKAREEITKFLEKEKKAQKITQYRLHDWLISRQRFWGCPIPIIYCDECGAVPVAEKDLPVKLPDDFKFKDSEGNPLEQCESFVDVKCPKCDGKARRETDTMDTFVDSSWYFLRYCNPKNSKKIFDPKKVNYWMPIDKYIGGKEHATMHLIYFRFFTKFFRDLKILKGDEPTYHLYNQGMLHKDGVVMSKSKGNVVSQEEISEKYGIDTARFFLMFVAAPDKDVEWDDKGVEGSYRFLNKVFSLLDKKLVDKDMPKQVSKVNKLIIDVTQDIEEMRYNLGLIKIMEMGNYLYRQEEISKKVLEQFVLVVSVFIPHIAEEMWSKLDGKGFVSLAKWPKGDKKKIDVTLEAEEALVEQVKEDVRKVLELAGMESADKITFIIADSWKFGLFSKVKKELEKTHNVGEIIKKVMDKKYGKEIGGLVPRLVKDPSKIPDTVLSQKVEEKVLEEVHQELVTEFGAHIETIIAEDSDEGKKGQAMPGRPAIIVK